MWLCPGAVSSGCVPPLFFLPFATTSENGVVHLDQLSDCAPENWHRSWDALRGILRGLEQRGMGPYEAVSSLIQLDTKRAESRSLNISSVTQFADRLGTNWLPSASERNVLQEFCTAVLQKISSISAQQQALQIRFDSLHHLVDPYLALISPMRALPPEILQEIFMACLPTSHNAIMHTTEAPLLFGRVCSAWRTISLSTPALWSSVHIVFSDLVDEIINTVGLPSDQELLAYPRVVQRRVGLQIWLQRSRNCPLSISLWHDCVLSRHIPAFADTIFPHRHRLKSLKVPDPVLCGLYYLSPDELPMLEVVDILDTSGRSTMPGCVQLFATAPNLRSISFRCETAHILPTRSWERITQLTLQSESSFFTPDLPQTLEVLAHCFNLQTCALLFPTTREHPSPGSAFSIPPPLLVGLSRLHTLSVVGTVAVDARFNVACFLEYLVLPALDQLTISIFPPSVSLFSERVRESSDIMLALDQLVMRSSCALSSLSICEASGDIVALLRCLRRLPGLNRLGIDYAWQSTARRPDLIAFFTELTACAGSDTPACPNLASLRLRNCDTRDNSEAYHHVLRTLIEARCHPYAQGITPLRHVDVQLRVRPLWDIVQMTEDMRPAKLNITIPEVLSERVMRKPSRWAGIPPEDEW
ncbi:hypothetical protein FB451DRAFT_1167851 [Mycena latifolia]|nr:hypothetical protein FB451DRAFT_1167851 [Mycena latifolia]